MRLATATFDKVWNCPTKCRIGQIIRKNNTLQRRGLGVDTETQLGFGVVVDETGLNVGFDNEE